MEAIKPSRAGTMYDSIPKLEDKASYKAWLEGVETYCLQHDLTSFFNGSAQKPLAPSTNGPGRSTTFQEYQRQITLYHKRRGEIMHLIYHTLAEPVQRQMGLQLDNLRMDVGPPKQILDRLDKLYGQKEELTFVNLSTVGEMDEPAEHATWEKNGDDEADTPVAPQLTGEDPIATAKRYANEDVERMQTQWLANNTVPHPSATFWLSGSDREPTVSTRKTSDGIANAATKEPASRATTHMTTETHHSSVNPLVPAKRESNGMEKETGKPEPVSRTTTHIATKPQPPKSDLNIPAKRAASEVGKATGKQEPASRKSSLVARKCSKSLTGLLTGILAERTAAVSTLLSLEAEGDMEDFFLQLKNTFLILGKSGLEVSDEVLVPFVLAKLARKRQDLLDALKLDRSKPEEIDYEKLVRLCVEIDGHGSGATRNPEVSKGSNAGKA